MNRLPTKRNYNGRACAVGIRRSFLLFNELLLWHTRIPPELQFNDSKLVEQSRMRCAGI